MTVRCQNTDGKCEHPLDIPDRPRISVTKFPEVPLAVAACLIQDPATINCPNCGFANPIMDGAAICAPEMTSILFTSNDAIQKLRENWGDDVHVAKMFNSSAVHISTDRRLFKRAFLTACITPHIDRLNSFSLQIMRTGRSLAEIIMECADELDNSFFAAVYLVASGTILVGQTTISAGQEPVSSFKPGADDSMARDPAALDELQRNLDSSAGEVAFLFAWVALLRGMQVHNDINWGVDKILSAIPRNYLALEGVEENFRKTLGSMRDRIDLTQPGAISMRCFVETAAALCYLGSREENPELDAYSRYMGFFELARTRDRSEEMQLVSPEIMHQLIDRDVFIEQVRTLTSSYARDMTSEQQMELAEAGEQTVRRLYPLEAPMPLPRVQIRGVMPEAVEGFVETVLASSSNEVPGLMLGVARHVLRSMAESDFANFDAALTVMDRVARRSAAEQRLWIASAMIEALNLASRFDEGLRLAEETVEALRPDLDAPGATPAPESRGTFYCELGNCYRYAARFQDALDSYQHALGHYGEQIAMRNQIGLFRNIAIVLRSMGGAPCRGRIYI